MMTMIFLSEAVARLQTSLPMASGRKAAGDVHRLWLIGFGRSCFATLNLVAHSGAWGP